MIRTVATLLFLILFLICSIPLLIAEWIIGHFNQSVKDRSSLAIVNWAFRMMARICGVKVITIGEDRIPKDTPVLYVGNHRSYFDIILTYVRVVRPTGYVSKIELKRVPLLSNWMRNLHCIFLNREDIREGMKAILKAVDEEKAGYSMCIFPEGTRNKVNDTFLPFHDASFKIAERADVPVVTMTIVNSAGVFEDHFPKVCGRQTVVIEYGEPIYIKDLDKETRKKVGSYFRDRISETYFKNKELYY